MIASFVMKRDFFGSCDTFWKIRGARTWALGLGLVLGRAAKTTGGTPALRRWRVQLVFQETLRQFFNITSYVAGGVLILLAGREWIQRTRLELPQWRNLVGASSIVLTAVNWLVILCLVLGVVLNVRMHHVADQWFDIAPVAGIVAALLALALKGKSRFRAAAAGLLMLLFWMTSFVQ